MPRSATRFDAQAAGFDQRAGIGDEAAHEVAQALAATAGLGATDWVLEIGAGTGEIGRQLAGTHRYVAIDLSLPMLEVFARRLTAPGLLMQADASRAWPVRSQSVRLLFAARAAHLLDRAHLVAELGRVGQPGGYLLIGRVDRQPDGLRQRLRTRRRALLVEQGIGATGDGEKRGQRLLDHLIDLGCTPVNRISVTRWTVETSAAELIAGWRDRGTVGGKPIPPAVHDAVLRALAAESAAESEQETETYTLEGVRLP